MESKRRSFLKNASILAGTALLGNPLSAFAGLNKTINNLTNGNHIIIYHTGNLNGQLSPNQQQLGGLNEINRFIHLQDRSGLVLDAGNFMGNTDVMAVISKMNKTGYHAVNVGKNELGAGQETLSGLLPFMDFPLLNCNYTLSNEVLSAKVKTYVTIYSGNLKIGITGLGGEIKGIPFLDPVSALNRTAEKLKNREGCDLVICLSDLDADDKKYNNIKLAGQSAQVDLIIGKNGSKIMKNAMISRNSKQEEVVLSQVVDQGLILGETSFGFNAGKEKMEFNHRYLLVGTDLENPAMQAHLVLRDMATARAVNA